MDRGQGTPANPASLIRQARRSMVTSEEEVRPMALRHRRASAPPICTDPECEGQSLGSSLRGKTFKTVGKATVRTFPSAVSMKISELPEGWKVVEAQAEKLCPGWIAIEPRGHVLEKDLAPASPLPSPREVSEVPLAPRSARRSMADAPLHNARQEAVEPRSARGQKPRSARNSAGGAPEVGAMLRKGRTSGDGGTPPQTAPPPRAPGARSSCQSPRTACTSPQNAPGAHAHGGGARTVRSMLSPRGMQARQSPRQGLSRSSSYATPSPQADATWLRTSPAGSATPEAIEVLALKEEQVLLRENNVDLREKELTKRKELEDLARAREAIAREVQQLKHSRLELKEMHETEQRELERQGCKMKEKLVRCRDVVAKAVGSIDDLYAAQDTSTRLSIGVMSSGGSSGYDCNAATDDLVHAKAQAQEAGAEVSLLLGTWSEGADQENPETSTVITKKILEEDSRPERAPLRACNAGF